MFLLLAALMQMASAVPVKAVDGIKPEELNWYLAGLFDATRQWNPIPPRSVCIEKLGLLGFTRHFLNLSANFKTLPANDKARIAFENAEMSSVAELIIERECGVYRQ